MLNKIITNNLATAFNESILKVPIASFYPFQVLQKLAKYNSLFLFIDRKKREEIGK